MASSVIEAADYAAAVELCHDKGWTDGLPVVPPTPELVAQFVAAGGRPRDEEIGFYTLRNRPVVVEKLAINAVMAGCRPEYFPVVLALADCLMDPDLEIHTASSSTGSLSLGFIVNGPVRRELGMNWRGNVLGPGNRANASIGRALRLIQTNVFGSVPGAGGEGQGGRPILDRATLGTPMRYASFHVVENEEDFPALEPLHVMRGFDRGDSVVTAAAFGNHYVMMSNHFEKTPEDWIESVAHYTVGSGRLQAGGWGMLIVPPEAAHMFVDAGWSKADIAQALFDRSRRTQAWVKENGWKIGGRFERGGKVEPGDEDILLGLAGSPEQIMVVVSGGPAGNFPLWAPTYAANFAFVSRRVGDHKRNRQPTEGAQDAIRAAIAPLSAQLRADDYDLQLTGVHEVALSFAITAGASACADCLVPKSMMTRYPARRAGPVAALEGYSDRARLSRRPAGLKVGLHRSEAA